MVVLVVAAAAQRLLVLLVQVMLEVQVAQELHYQ
jgi:hypothetical protein